MLKQLGLLLGLGLVLLSGNAQANRNVELEQESQTFSSGNKVAVVIGINKYSRLSGLKNLKYARSDAQIINSVLDKRHGYETTPLLGSDANKNHILAAIQNAGSRLRGKNGTLIFFFAGHGFSKGNRNYLATADFAMNQMAQSALTIHELEQAIRRTGARRAIIFIDACREDPWVGGARNFAQDSFRVRQSKGIQHLFGSEFGKQSWETDKLKHGVFSYFLYRGLNGEAVESNGLISFDSLTGYVQEEVGKWSHQNLPVTQTPFSEGKAYGVFVLGQVGGRRQPTQPARRLTPTSPQPPRRLAPTSPQLSRSTPNIPIVFSMDSDGYVTDYGDWRLKCEMTPYDINECFVEQIIREQGQNGTIMTAMIGYGNKKNLPTFVLELPKGIDMSQGIRLRVDKYEPVNFSGECDNQGCRAKFRLNQPLTQQISKGKKVFVAFRKEGIGEPTVLTVSLKGMSAALYILQKTR